MASPEELAQYIESQLKKGYDLAAVRSFLLRYGHKPEEIDSAIAFLTQRNLSKKSIFQEPKTLVAVGAMALSLFVIAFLFFFSKDIFPDNVTYQPRQLLDLTTEPVTSTLNAGDTLVFLKELSNLGSSARYDIILNHEVRSLDTNLLLTFKKETVGIETRGSTQTRIPLPQDARAGSYLVQTTATYGSQKAEASFIIQIVPKDSQKPIPQSCSNKIKDQGETGIDCGGPCRACWKEQSTCFDGIRNGLEQDVDCGGVCKSCPQITPVQTSYKEIGEKALAIAELSPANAKKYCLSLDQNSASYCLSWLATKRGDITNCDVNPIEEDKSFCISSAVVDNPVLDCETIKDKETRDWCSQVHLAFQIPPRNESTEP